MVVVIFGAPDLPRRPASPTPRAARRPGVGDHVTLFGGYAGLIVDIDRDGKATVASRSGKRVVETELEVTSLAIAESVPLGFDECVDRAWTRGSLG